MARVPLLEALLKRMPEKNFATKDSQLRRSRPTFRNHILLYVPHNPVTER